MKRRFLLCVLAAVVLVGCIEEGDPLSFHITANQTINRKVQCAVKGQSAAVELTPIGTMDLLQTSRYLLFPVIESHLTTVESIVGQGPSSGQLEPMYIRLAGAWVSYEINGLTEPYWGDNPPEGAYSSMPDKIYVPTSGSIEFDSEAATIVEVVPPKVGQFLDANLAFDELYSAGYLRLKVVLQGFLNDGTELRSSEFYFPIKVCRGCMYYYHIPPSQCCEEGAPIGDDDQIPCFPGQDEPSTCALACLVSQGSDRVAAKQAMISGLITNLSQPIP